MHVHGGADTSNDLHVVWVARQKLQQTNTHVQLQLYGYACVRLVAIIAVATWVPGSSHVGSTTNAKCFVQDSGDTPLTCACYKGAADIAQLLLSHGADVTSFDAKVGTRLQLLPYQTVLQSLAQYRKVGS